MIQQWKLIESFEDPMYTKTDKFMSSIKLKGRNIKKQKRGFTPYFFFLTKDFFFKKNNLMLDFSFVLRGFVSKV